jgi:antitoxin component YwqK of YwqJK toxin-antitoxin module
MSKKIYTIQSSDKKNFDKKVNELLEFGGELLENSYGVINTDDGIIYSQVIEFINNCELEFYDNGEIKSIKNESKKTGWFESGIKKSEYFLIDNKINGLYTVWYESGKKYSEDMWENDKRNGLRTTWFENGQKQYEGNQKDNSPDGLNTLWYENGQKQVEDYSEDGHNSGPRIEWYENGQKKEEGNYKLVYTEWGPLKGNMGHKDGLWTGWYQNGQKQYEGNYKIVKKKEIEMNIIGLPDGLWIRWYDSGKKESEVTFKKGDLISEKHWKEDGSVKENFFIKDIHK